MPMLPEKSIGERLWAFAIWALVIFFVVNVIATIAAVSVEFVRDPMVQFLAAGQLHNALVPSGVERISAP